MNARSAVFSYLAIKPSSVEELRCRLPYASKTIYKEEEELVKEGLVIKYRRDGKILLGIASGFRPQRLKEIYVRCLSRGIDPEMLFRDSTRKVWLLLDEPRTVVDIGKMSGLSGKWIKKVLNDLHGHALVEYRNRKPIIAVRNRKHVVNNLLGSYLSSNERGAVVHYPGSIPFDEVLDTPERIERRLYELIRECRNLTVRDTGFLVKGGGGRITIFESVDHELSPEEYFLKKLRSAEGVEDICVLIVKQGSLDYDDLLILAGERGLVNVVGCYLDILHDIDGDMVPHGVIEMFEGHKIKSKKMFLREEKKYGKSGWEQPYEERWNVDLYLERGAIEHGVRGL